MKLQSLYNHLSTMETRRRENLPCQSAFFPKTRPRVGLKLLGCFEKEITEHSKALNWSERSVGLRFENWLCSDVLVQLNLRPESPSISVLSQNAKPRMDPKPKIDHSVSAFPELRLDHSTPASLMAAAIDLAQIRNNCDGFLKSAFP